MSEEIEYRNKAVINQRGASIEIINSTGREQLNLTHYSGSNIILNNVVNSELATNNKQTNVLFDLFETVGNNKNVFVGKDLSTTITGSNYNICGIGDPSEISGLEEWKKSFEPIAQANAKFKTNRGGTSYPNGSNTPIEGVRGDNPTLNQTVSPVENSFRGYTTGAATTVYPSGLINVPVRDYYNDEVTNFTTILDYNTNLSQSTFTADCTTISVDDILFAAGAPFGSELLDVLIFGAAQSASTEDGSWTYNTDASNLHDTIIAKQEELNAIEQKLGEGGDSISLVKRNKTEQIGGIVNDYPSVRIDSKGRSQPKEMVVGSKSSFANHGATSLVEKVDNSSMFPCGKYDLTVGDRFNIVIGSGGLQIKTTGSIDIEGATINLNAAQVTIDASNGVIIGSPENIEIQSKGGIQLRTDRQVFVESGLGVRKNVTVGGGLYVEGETYLHHITAPLEVQQTHDTIVKGQFDTADWPNIGTSQSTFGANSDDTSPGGNLLIGEGEQQGDILIGYAVGTDSAGDSHYLKVYSIRERTSKVYANPLPNRIVNYAHSHNFNNIPIRLTASNRKVRTFAGEENINKFEYPAVAMPVEHEKKEPV